ncbi:squalene/phytoene synthase family protein [Microbacterium gorillae]|uniref:squalene/phytoene synthase family protein n=1 Tax=Microbacterium gorillae TaxID=1231063 RepID=UPI0006939A4B|nr:squalene/phytoene synthase family protein [Microbacterium gorillae]
MSRAALDRFELTAYRACVTVMREYSTSFGWASRLLAPGMERDIGAVYAMVRVGDEIVDGTASQAGFTGAQCSRALDDYEQRVLTAVTDGFSSDLVLHAFARTARACGIDGALIAPFFASMRADLAPVDFTTADELDAYVYGSAEVVGLMCLRVFTRMRPLSGRDRAEAEAGARALGSAFQRVNFLRDLGDDAERLHRRYLPELDPADPDRIGRAAVITRIRADLRRTPPHPHPPLFVGSVRCV